MQETDINGLQSHLSILSVLIRAVWSAPLFIFQVPSERQIVVVLLVNHPYLLSGFFSVGASGAGHSHGRLALRLDQSQSRPACTVSSSDVSCEAGSSVLGALQFCGGAVVQGEVDGHGSEGLEMVIQHLQAPAVIRRDSRGVCGFNTAGGASPLSGDLTGVKANTKDIM